MPVIILNQNKVRQISYFNFICSPCIALRSNLNAEFVWERCAHISELNVYWKETDLIVSWIVSVGSVCKFEVSIINNNTSCG